MLKADIKKETSGLLGQLQEAVKEKKGKKAVYPIMKSLLSLTMRNQVLYPELLSS